MAKEQLSRDAWLDAAGDAIADGGFDNVRILLIADKLGVTRGSFYWHFEDHLEFVKSFLERWRDRRMALLAYWQPPENDAEEELRRIFHLLVGEGESARSLRRIRIELAIRDYARRDELARKVVEDVDNARLHQAERLCEVFTKDASKARPLALMLYATTVGAQLMLGGPAGDDSAVAMVENQLFEFIMSQKRQRRPRAKKDSDDTAPASSDLSPIAR